MRNLGQDAFQKFFFGNCVISFIVIGANAGSCADELVYDSLGKRPHGNLLCKINYRFAKSSCSLFQIVDRFRLRLLANKRRLIIGPKRVIRLAGIFELRHSFVIRHSSFVIYASISVAQRA